MAWRTVVVDDTAEMRWLVKTFLAHDPDFEVVGEAEDGISGIEVISRQRPDLVMLDWWMPGLDGLATLPEIHRNAPEAVVVMMSASEPEDIQDWAMSAGADAFYTKDPRAACRLADDMRAVMAKRYARRPRAVPEVG